MGPSVRILIAATLCAASTTSAAADPVGLCQLEEQGAKPAPCPSYVTYDEEGEEVGAAESEEAR